MCRRVKKFLFLIYRDIHIKSKCVGVEIPSSQYKYKTMDGWMDGWKIVFKVLTLRNSTFNDLIFLRIKCGKCLVKRRGFATIISKKITQDTTPTRIAKV